MNNGADDAGGGNRKILEQVYEQDPVLAVVQALQPIAHVWMMILEDLDHDPAPYRVRQRLMWRWRKVVHRITDEVLKTARIEHMLRKNYATTVRKSKKSNHP